MNPLTVKTIGRYRKTGQKKQKNLPPVSLSVWKQVNGMWKDKKENIIAWQRKIRHEWI
jgi:hypothetical protein